MRKNPYVTMRTIQENKIPKENKEEWTFGEKV